MFKLYQIREERTKTAQNFSLYPLIIVKIFFSGREARCAETADDEPPNAKKE